MRLLTITLFLFLSTFVFSQNNAPNESCKKYKSLYYEYLKQGMYEDARNFWRKAAKNCGGLVRQDERFFINGVAIYKGLRKNLPKNDSLSHQLINDTLSNIYKTGWLVHQNKEWSLDYAYHLYYYTDANTNQMEELFKNVHLLKGKTNAIAIETYFKFQIKKKFVNAKKEDRLLLSKQILQDYFLLRDYCDSGIDSAMNEKTIKRYEDAKKYLKAYLLKVPLQKNDINELFTVKYADYSINKEVRLKQIERDIALLEKLNVKDLLIYNELIYEFLRLKPTANGYLLLGNMELSQQKNSEAIAAYNQAIQLEPSDIEKNEIYYKKSVALYQQRKYKQAFLGVKKSEGKYKGKAFKLAGDCIVASINSCGNSTFERKANYWLANDYYRKAKAHGENVNEASFSAKWPTLSECFAEKINEGSRYHLPCWNEFTVVR